MTPSQKKQSNFRIDPDIMEGLQRVKEEDGVPISEQVRRALREWLQRRGVIDVKESASRRVSPRRKA